MALDLPYSRIFTEMLNTQKTKVVFDFASANYIATKEFFTKLSSIQTELITTGVVTLGTGQTADASTTAGMIAIQLYMETIESQRTSMEGLAKLGLGVEKQIWKNI